MDNKQQVLKKSASSFTKFLITVILILLIALFSIILFGVFSYKSISAQMEFSKGSKLLDDGRFDDAKASMNKVIKTAPDSPAAKKARIILKIRIPKSNKISEEAINYNIEGFNEMYSGNYDKAIELFDKAIKASPDFEWPYNNKAIIFYRKKFYKESIDLSKEALKINPDYLIAHKNIANNYFSLARKYIENKDYKTAEAYMKASIKSLKKAESLDPLDKQFSDDIEDAQDYLKLIEKRK